MTRHWRTLLCLFCTFFLIDCTDSADGKDALTSSQTSNGQSSNSNPDALSKVMRIYIGGPNIGIPTKDDFAEYVRDFSNPTLNHVFYHPNNRANFTDLEAAQAITHEVAENALLTEIAKPVAEHQPNRLVIFLQTHGQAGNGNLCFTSGISCTVNAQTIYDVLKNLDQENLTRSADKQIKQILIVPGSCYNKPLSEGIMQLLNAGNATSFSVAIMHMTQVLEADCPGVGQSLFSRELHFTQKDFKVWAQSDNHEKQLFDMKTLEELVSVANSIYNTKPIKVTYYKGNGVIDNNIDHFELRPIRMVVNTFPFNQYNTLPHELTVGIVLNYFLPADLISRVTSMNFVGIENIAMEDKNRELPYFAEFQMRFFINLK